MKRENNDSIFFWNGYFIFIDADIELSPTDDVFRWEQQQQIFRKSFSPLPAAAASSRPAPPPPFWPEFVAKQQHNSGKITTAAPTTTMTTTTAMTPTTTTKIAQPNAGPSYFDKFIESSRERKCVTRYKCINIDRYIAEKQDYILRNDREKQRDEKINNNNQLLPQ